MCNPASFVIVNQGEGLVALWDKSISESHEDIISYFNLKDDKIPPSFVRVEINPPSYPGAGYAAPLDRWTFKTDQDSLPGWYDSGQAETVCRRELEAWLAAKVVLPGQERAAVNNGDYVFASFGTIEAVNGGTIEAVWDGIIEHVWGGTIKAVHGGVIKAVNGGIIEHVWGGVIEAVNGGTIEHVWGGVIEAVNGGTIEAVRGGIIEHVWGGTIENVRGGTIEAVWDGTVISYIKIEPSILKSSRAVLIDRSGDKVVVHVGKDAQ